MKVLLITDRHVMAAQHGDFATALRAALPLYRAHSWRDQIVLLVRDKDASDAERAELITIACNSVPADVRIMVSSFVPAGVSAPHRARITGLHAPEAVPLNELQADVATWQRPGQPALVGCSRHTTAGVVAAARAGASYVQLGPVWPTPSKAGMGEPIGLAGLRDARAALAASASNCNLVAVGGITDGSHATQAAAAGADAIAVIRAVWASPAPADRLAHLLHSLTTPRLT